MLCAKPIVYLYLKKTDITTLKHEVRTRWRGLAVTFYELFHNGTLGVSWQVQNFSLKSILGQVKPFGNGQIRFKYIPHPV